MMKEWVSASSLMAAVEAGSMEEIQQLLAANVDVNGQDKVGTDIVQLWCDGVLMSRIL